MCGQDGSQLPSQLLSCRPAGRFSSLLFFPLVQPTSLADVPLYISTSSRAAILAFPRWKCECGQGDAVLSTLLTHSRMGVR